MRSIGKKEKHQIVGVTLFFLALIFLTAQFLYLRGVGSLRPIYIFNIAVDLSGMVTGYVLFVCCMIDVEKTGSDLRYLLRLIICAFLGLFFDAGAWLVDGIPELRVLNLLDNTCYYICAPVIGYLFWRYVTDYMGLRGRIVTAYTKALWVGLWIGITMRVLNLFTGIYFTVGEDGVFARGPYVVVSFLYVVTTLLLTLGLIVRIRKRLLLFQRVTLYLYVAGPFFATLLTLAVYGLSIAFAVVMLTILLMYCALNVTQGRERAAADQDMKVAAQIQEHMLPQIFPPFPDRGEEFELFASMTPAKEVGGDFYDFFLIDDDHLVLTIADVSGKGIPAALFMMVSRTLIKNQILSRGAVHPSEILREVNQRLTEEEAEIDMFVTVWLGILTISTGQLSYANAGHEYPVLRRAGGTFEIFKERHSPPLATMEGLSFRGGELALFPGDVLFVYTDGVTEATNDRNELFGEARMLSALDQVRDRPVEEMDRALRSAIAGFVGEAPQFDDITMLTLRYHHKGSVS